ncbi:SpoIIE family protein phosphatase [candidate division KSB1 bacterium]|nr:SpoIIE family protein phosphatase [candidate division KSB1 bacterium]
MTDKPSLEQLEKENRRLHRAVEELAILNEIATAISSTQSLEAIIDKIVQKCIQHLHVQQAVVNLLGEKSKIQQLNTMVRGADSSAVIPFRLDTELTGWMITNQKPLLSNDLANDSRFHYSKHENLSLHSVLCVPMTLNGRLMGLVSCFNKKSPEGFDGQDQRLLCIIATQSAQIIENARLRQKEEDLIRVEEELRLACEIQTGLLPKSTPELKGYDVTGISLPARIVGGDYFDYILIDEFHYAFCLGDISGKGLPAAVLMANLQATIKGLVMSDPQPDRCLARANTILFRNTSPNRFATMFYGVLNLKTNQILYSNAGHNRPILVSSSGHITELQSAGLALGFLENTPYSTDLARLDKGDSLVIYSDGVTEAMNPDEEEYGEERLYQLIQSVYDEPARNIQDKLIESVKTFTQGHPQSDDITLVVIKSC